jgi:Fur family ferric uptake transcriptional regulator
MPLKRNRVEIERFHDFLRDKGLKKTYQKDLILETFLGIEGHLSVEDVYLQVKKKDRKVGIVTVFRTLKSLKECGIAREVTLGDGLTRFEHSYQHPYHHHIICKNCHKTIEFVCPKMERIQEDIIEKYGFKPDYHRVQTYGICKDCIENRTTGKAEDFDTEKIFARDALRMALQMANRCLNFYKVSAERNKDLGGREVFERLVREEEKHIADLNSKLEELYSQQKNLERAPLFLHFDAEELDAMFPDLSKYQTGELLNLDRQTASQLTYRLNLKSSEFFKKYADKFSDTMGKRIFVNFAIQEEKHNDSLEKTMGERL